MLRWGVEIDFGGGILGVMKWYCWIQNRILSRMHFSDSFWLPYIVFQSSQY